MMSEYDPDEHLPILARGRIHLDVVKGSCDGLPVKAVVSDEGYHGSSNNSPREGKYETFATPNSGLDPVTLSWQNITVSVKGKEKTCCHGDDVATPKQILKNVTGLVKPGMLTAVMGVSGTGKSTLMNVLAHRNTQQYDVTGDISVNGVNVGNGIRNISAYCQQDEMFIGTLTVKEHLEFRALLRMDKTLPERARKQRVEEVMSETGLTVCADTEIGTPGKKKGISGGQMRRLSFASELLTNPPLMFCDEPTSGLDCFMAESIVKTLKTMAQRGRTIVCTIHQPSSEVFQLFDHLLLLSEGYIAYLGSAGQAEKFFLSQGHLCPANHNLADFYINTLAIDPGREEDCRRKAVALCDAFRKSEVNQTLLCNLQEVRDQSQANINSSLFQHAFNNGNDRYSSPGHKQLQMLLWRSGIGMRRDAAVFVAQGLQTVLAAVFLGLVYLMQKYDQSGVMNIDAAIFLLITNLSFTCMFSVVNSFPAEMPVFMREYGTGLYRVDIYFISKTLSELPTLIILPALFASISYWMIGLNASVTCFLVFVGMMILVANVAASFGYLISTASGSIDVALNIAPSLFIAFTLFGGFFLNSSSVPVYFIWLQYLSWFNYANEVLVINQWDTIDYIACGEVSNSTADVCFRDGRDIIDYLHFHQESYYLDIGLLFVLLVGFRLLAFLLLLLKAKRSKA